MDDQQKTSKPTSVWSRYGFRSTPYSTNAIAFDSATPELLVGREVELELVLSDLISGAHLIALEGDYGVGKSSLAAVAAYQASSWPVRPKEAWFLATRAAFELAEADTPDSFERRVYFSVARAVLEKAPILLREGIQLDSVAEFALWLQSPTGSTWNAGVGLNVAALGGLTISGGKGKSANTSAGFTDGGAVALIDRWLVELFPSLEHGGIICRLDNLEALARSPKLVELFESLRDRLFKRQGLRWIISGAEGMVRVALGTPKMTGTFSEPIDLYPLDPIFVPTVIDRRGDALKLRNDAVLPVDPLTFEKVYLSTGKNLRFALGTADRYALRSKPADVLWLDAAGRTERYLRYVDEEGQKVVAQASAHLKQRTWEVLNILVTHKSGFCSPSEFRDFGFGTMPGLLNHLTNLENLGLIQYKVDEEDARRRRVTTTDQGRLAIARKFPQASADNPVPGAAGSVPDE